MTKSHDAAIHILTDYHDLLEQAEREGPMHFAEAFANGPPDVGVHEIDHQMRVVRISPEELRLLGYEEKQVWAGRCGR